MIAVVVMVMPGGATGTGPCAPPLRTIDDVESVAPETPTGAAPLAPPTRTMPEVVTVAAGGVDGAAGGAGGAGAGAAAGAGAGAGAGEGAGAGAAAGGGAGVGAGGAAGGAGILVAGFGTEKTIGVATFATTVAAGPVTSRVLSAGAISFMSSDIAVTVKVTFDGLPLNGALTGTDEPDLIAMSVE